jgi:hypothetical protein
MNGFDIVMVIAVILFARLGVRLVARYLKLRREEKARKQDRDTQKGTEQ